MKLCYRNFSHSILFGMFILTANAAHAATWSSTASSCVPGASSIGKYVFDNASLKFAPGETGEVKVRCHITNPFDDTGDRPVWNTITVGFKDPDSNNGSKDAGVTVKLIRVRKDDSTFDPIRSFNSNDPDTNGSPSEISRSIHFTHQFDFKNFAYYIELIVSRNSASFDPAVWFVKLSNEDQP